MGDYVFFGTYEQDNDTANGKEGIEWLVLAKENNRSLNAQLEYLAKVCVKEFEDANGSIPVDDEKLYRK